MEQLFTIQLSISRQVIGYWGCMLVGLASVRLLYDTGSWRAECGRRFDWVLPVQAVQQTSSQRCRWRQHTWLEYDSVRCGTMTWTWPLAPIVPDSSSGFWFVTHRLQSHDTTTVVHMVNEVDRIIKNI